MEDSVKRWTAERKMAPVVEIIRGKTTVAEASRAYDLSPSKIEAWVDDAKRGMDFEGTVAPDAAAYAPKMALPANRLEIREQYEKPLMDLKEA
jgi:transposase-like protein